MYVTYDRPDRHEVFARCWYSVGPQSVRRLIGFVPALGGRISCFVVMTMGAIAQSSSSIRLSALTVRPDRARCCSVDSTH